MRDALNTNRTKRYTLCGLITANRARTSSLTTAMQALIDAGSLTSIDTGTFGFLANNVADDSVVCTASGVDATSVNNPFASTDVGRTIHIAGAGTAGATHTTTIATYVDAGHVTLTAAAITTTTATATSATGLAVWGDLHTSKNDRVQDKDANDVYYYTREQERSASSSYTNPGAGTRDESFGASAGAALDALSVDVTAFGYHALTAATGQTGATAFGSQALAAVTTTDVQATAFGYKALLLNSSGVRNQAEGWAAGSAITSGSDNTIAGHQALNAASTVTGCSGFGSQVLKSVTTTDVKASAFGYHVLQALTTGTNDCCFGYQAGTALTSGSDNCIFGFGGMIAATLASGCVAIGSNVMAALTTGNPQSVGIGHNVLTNLTTGDSLVCIGYEAGKQITTTANAVAVGYQSATNMRGQRWVAIGYAALSGTGTPANNVGADLVAIGYQALNGCKGSTDSVAVGRNAMYATTDAHSSIAIGSYSLDAATSNAVNKCCALGHNALGQLTTGVATIGLGAYAGQAATNSSNTLYIGDTTFDATANAINTITIQSSNAAGASFSTALQFAGVVTFNAAVIPTPVTLTDAATIATNAALGNYFEITLGASRTMGAPTNPVNGQVITYGIRQSGAGSFTITWNGAFLFTTSKPAPTLQTALNKLDLVSFRYDGTNSKWRILDTNMQD